MQITKKKIALLAAADLVVVAAGAWLVYWMVLGGETAPAKEVLIEQGREATSTESVDGQAPAAEPKLSCADQLKKDTADSGAAHATGTILVSFKPTVTYAQAKSVLDSKGLKPHNTASSEEFEANHWLTVRVPKNEEFDWICALQGAPEVRRAGLNPIFDLAD